MERVIYNRTPQLRYIIAPFLRRSHITGKGEEGRAVAPLESYTGRAKIGNPSNIKSVSCPQYTGAPPEGLQIPWLKGRPAQYQGCISMGDGTPEAPMFNLMLEPSVVKQVSLFRRIGVSSISSSGFVSQLLGKGIFPGGPISKMIGPLSPPGHSSPSQEDRKRFPALKVSPHRHLNTLSSSLVGFHAHSFVNSYSLICLLLIIQIKTIKP